MRIDSCLSTTHQENINRLIEVWDDPQHVYLVLEYVDGGDLLDYIMNRATNPGPGLSEAFALELGVVDALMIRLLLAEEEAIKLTRMICAGMSVSSKYPLLCLRLTLENDSIPYVLRSKQLQLIDR